MSDISLQNNIGISVSRKIFSEYVYNEYIIPNINMLSEEIKKLLSEQPKKIKGKYLSALLRDKYLLIIDENKRPRKNCTFDNWLNYHGNELLNNILYHLETQSTQIGESADWLQMIPESSYIQYMIRNHFEIEDLSSDKSQILNALFNMFDHSKEILSESSDSKNNKNEILNKQEFIKNILMDDEYLNKEKIVGRFIECLKEYYNAKSFISSKDFRKKLLNCEKIRADIDPYEEKILTDPNRGHWDLYSDKNTEYTIKINNEVNYYSRNPEKDVNYDGAIAIDFGTKSTIVVYQKETQNSLPMGIGLGKLQSASNPKRFENPTVMQFVNLEKFIKNYSEKAGRPHSNWEDLPISHTALERFQESSSEEYYSFLYQIKQWAGWENKKLRIKTINNETKELPPFLSLKEDDFNPIEFYAYYIGLYINNMRNGIYLDYSLSFPVTYETEIRNKITESFEKGIKKSLPESILNNPEIMENFRINSDFSEPQAYAACALREYGFEPTDNEEILYGIFDFGGGTTDFDFGIWKLPEKKSNKYNYALENFSTPNGDRYLGGENLLEMLAYEVFKENKDTVMLPGNYSFTCPPGMSDFIGSDAFLSDSQEAERNMHNLMEALRPYWEERSKDYYFVYPDEISLKKLEEINEVLKGKIQSKDDKYDQLYQEIQAFIMGKDSSNTTEDELIPKFDKLENAYNEIQKKLDEKIILKVALYNKDGVDTQNVELQTNRNTIYHLIETRIESGIENFFDALTQAFQNRNIPENIEKVNIFLAGNSCKSPIVKFLFKKKLAEKTEEISNIAGKEIPSRELFEIFPPLGTPEAEKKLSERNIVVSKPLEERPTGKTGVAFGLLKFRDDGIKIIKKSLASEQIPFRFYIGYNKKDCFTLFEDDSQRSATKGKPDYDKWYRYIEADEDSFYLYYTDLPNAISGNLRINGNSQVRRIKINIKATDDAFVYIRATKPHEIQYVVSTTDDIEKKKVSEIITRELKVE